MNDTAKNAAGVGTLRMNQSSGHGGVTGDPEFGRMVCFGVVTKKNIPQRNSQKNLEIVRRSFLVFICVCLMESLFFFFFFCCVPRVRIPKSSNIDNCEWGEAIV